MREYRVLPTVYNTCVRVLYSEDACVYREGCYTATSAWFFVDPSLSDMDGMTAIHWSVQRHDTRALQVGQLPVPLIHDTACIPASELHVLFVCVVASKLWELQVLWQQGQDSDASGCWRGNWSHMKAKGYLNLFSPVIIKLYTSSYRIVPSSHVQYWTLPMIII